MNSFERLFLFVKRNGIKEYLAERIRIFLGIQKYNDNINTIFYFLNRCLKPSDLPPTEDPDLRIMQKCNVMLLCIFDRICKKHDVNYWLDYGTLLGAVRHNGFIPWDDDMDISMERSDYDRLASTVKQELKSYGIDFEENVGSINTIGISYKHEQTGIWLDVFPFDKYNSKGDFKLSKEKLIQKLNKNRNRLNFSRRRDKQFLEELRNKFVHDEKDYDRTLYYLGIETNCPYDIHDKSVIIPLSEVCFEGFKFPAPNSSSSYLEDIYGSRFMELPHCGVLHHDGGRGALSTWAKKSGIDMNEVYNYLLNVYKSIDINE